MKKTLIESRSIEMLKLFDKVSADAQKEKLASPPSTKLLYYWTKKPLVVGRAVALASTLDDIDVVYDLMGFRSDTRAYKIPPDLKMYEKTLGKKPSEIKVLDPFAGSGNLMLPARRLGLDCTCVDYNPVAHILQRAVLDFPVKYGKKLVELFEQYTEEIFDKTKKQMQEFYGEGDLAYFWVWCVKCPHCDQRIPLTNNMWLANTKKNKIGIRFHVTSNKNFKTEIIHNIIPSDGEKFTQKGGAVICISCKNTVDKKTFTADIAKRKDRELIVIRKNIKGTKTYVLASKNDKKRYAHACSVFEQKKKKFKKLDLIPYEDIKAAFRKEHILWKFGIKNWNDYYSPRHLLTFATLMKNIKDALNNADKLATPLSVYLAFWLCKHIGYNSFGVFWVSSGEKPGQTLALRQPTFMMNHIEINPFEKVSGSLLNMQSNIKEGLEFITNYSNPVEISLDSVTNISKHSPKMYDLVITDPPYLDDVTYGESSEFFYVWIKRIITKYFSYMPKSIPLEEDFCQSWGRFGDKQTALEFFEKGLKKSFTTIRSSLKDDGLLVVFFAHSSTYGWNILLECVRNSKFQVISSYAVHTESTANVIARGKTAFMSSIIVTCRKIQHGSSAYYEDIIPETEDSIKSMLNEISTDKLLTIPITDLLIMTYGQILEVCTKFTELKSYKADFTPNFENLIEGSGNFIMREIVSKITGSSINFIGSEMAFYILARVFFSGRIPPDDTIKITRSLNIEKSSPVNDGIAKSDQGALVVIPLHKNEQDIQLEDIGNVSLYQQTCILVIACHTGGINKVTSVLSKSDKFRIEDLKKVVTLLVKNYRLQTNKGKKLGKLEQEEMKIMEILSDMWGGVKVGGTLEGFT